MKATRDALGDALPLMGEKCPNILALTADLGGATKLIKFKDRFPERYFDVGIAEANMIGVASGLSEHGFKVFVSSFASFLTGRYDIIRCSLAYSKAPVVLVGTHVGMAIGKDGVTQMGLEDVSIMRALPNMKIYNPATYTEAKQVIEYLCENELDGPCYLRLGRQPVRDVLEEKEIAFDGGPWIVKDAQDVAATRPEITILSTGCVLPDVLEAAEMLDKKVRVVHFPVIKPLDAGMVSWVADTTTQLVCSVEDHSIVGGFGSAVSEVLAEDGRGPRLLRIGLNDEFPESAPPKDLYEKYGLSATKIAERIRKEFE